MMFLRKVPQEKLKPIEETKAVIKLTKKQKLQQKKLELKEKLLEEKRTLLKEHLQRELRYGKNTQKRHENNWRHMLTQITLPLHREQLEFTWQTFERVMDAKDFIISCLMDEIRQHEDQHLQSIVMHVSRVDRLVDVFHTRLQELQHQFDSTLNMLDKKHQEFLYNMHLTCEDSMNRLKTVSYGMELEEKERERSLRADLCSKVECETDDKRGINLELREKLMFSLEDMQKNTHDTIDKFLKKTRKRREDYEAAQLAEDKAQELLACGMRKIDHLNASIRKLMKKEDDIGHNELTTLEGERNFFKHASLLLKQNLVVDLKVDKAKIEFLVGEIHKAQEGMKKSLKRGETMIHLLRCTKKLETSEEKVRPYPILRHVAEQAVKQKPFFLFWQRVGKVDFTRSALIEERNSLMLENRIIRRKITAVCSCLSCPRLPPICHREGAIPFTDGATLMKKYEKISKEKRRFSIR